MLYFDYKKSEAYCHQIGLVWLGEQYLAGGDNAAWEAGMSQDQIEAIMPYFLLHIKTLFTPQRYSFLGRLVIAFYFLTGWKLK